MALSSMLRVPASVKAEPGRAMLGVLLSVVFVVSLGDLFLPVVVLFAASFVGGWVARSAHQPALVGMLIAGCATRNLFPAEVALPAAWLSGTLRSLSLALIMLRAGMSLEVSALLAQPLKVGLLSALPCFVEVATVAVLASWAFSTGAASAGVGAEEDEMALSSFSFDYRWGVLLGFCLSDVSPAVSVPLLLDLQRLGRGARRGVPSVLIAAASLNAVWAIVGFSITLRLLFGDHSSGALSNAGVRAMRASGLALLEVVGGAMYGLAVGWLLSFMLEVAVAEARQRDALRRRLPHTSLPTFGLAGGRRYYPLDSASSRGVKSGQAPAAVSGRKYQYSAAPLDSSLLKSSHSNESGDAAGSNRSPHENPQSSSSSSNGVAVTLPSLREAHTASRSHGNGNDDSDDPCAMLHGQLATALLSAAAACTIAGKVLHLHGGGALGAACVGIACQAACEDGSTSEGRTSSSGATHTTACLNGAKGTLAKWWDNVGSALLFGLLGARVDLATLEWHFAVLATSIVAAALVPRAVAAYYCAGDALVTATSSSSRIVSGSFDRSNSRDQQQQRQWTRHEKLFAALCWCPKGTVQAALSTLALDAVAAHASAYPNVLGGNVVPFDATEAADARRAQIVFTVAVVSIFATAVPFAGLIKYFGPKLLALDGNSSSDIGGLGVLESESADCARADYTTSATDAARERTPEDASAAIENQEVLPLSAIADKGAISSAVVLDRAANYREEDLLGIGSFLPVLNPPPSPNI